MHSLDNDDGWFEHWQDRHQRSSSQLLGPRGTGGAAGAVGQILSGWQSTSTTYWLPQKLPQICTVIVYICIVKVA